MRSEALSWLLSSLFYPTQCFLSLGQWQEELTGPEIVLLLWYEGGLVQMVTQEAGGRGVGI